jgi:YgiT-type zinc finger domain-containing protein
MNRIRNYGSPILKAKFNHIKNKQMKCTICKHGETHEGHTTVTLERNESVIVFKNVPAQICSNCGEYYLSESTSAELLTQANEAISNGAVFELRNLRFAS